MIKGFRIFFISSLLDPLLCQKMLFCVNSLVFVLGNHFHLVIVYTLAV